MIEHTSHLASALSMHVSMYLATYVCPDPSICLPADLLPTYAS